MEKKICIKKESIGLLLDKLNENYDVYVPVLEKETGIIDFMNFNSIRNAERFSLNFNEKTKRSPKSIVFPATEDMFRFEYIKDPGKPDTTDIRITSDATLSRDSVQQDAAKQDRPGKKKIIFGMKPCDTAGIKSFDMVFNENGNEDIYYNKKRLDLVLISIGCKTIFPDCFCLAVGGNPFNFEYSDIGFIDNGRYFVILKQSENKTAEKLIEENREFFEERDFNVNDLKELDEIISQSNNLQDQLLNENSLERIEKDKMEKILETGFNSKVLWKVISEKCISCGSCTYVCPTCVCFNIGDEIKNLEGQRYRCWDFCTSYYYTLEASGHNPRGEIFQRYRNKINCKFNYFNKRKKMLYCVGCGRCVDVCPVGMDIREIIKRILTTEKQQ